VNGRATLAGAALPAPLTQGTKVTLQAVAGRGGGGGVKSEPIETSVGP
jgi:hypothetical protein